MTMRKSIAVLSILLASQQTEVGGFSMVAPAPPRSALASEWKTNTYNPIPIAEPDDILEFSKNILAESVTTTTMPALSSPLFGRRMNPEENSRLYLKEQQRLKSLTPYEMKSRILKDMTAFVVEELEKAQMTKERNVLLSTVRAETQILDKTVQKVVNVQENLQYVWDAAGVAMMEFGLSDVAGLPLPNKEQEDNLFHTVKLQSDNLFDLITYTHSSSQEAKDDTKMNP